MNRIPMRYWLSVALFIDISSVAAIGFILAFLVPEGRGERGAKFFLGLHRHVWGDIHLYLSVLMVVLLFFHLRNNWHYIIQSTRKYFGESWRKALWGVGGAWLGVLAVGWLLAML